MTQQILLVEENGIMTDLIKDALWGLGDVVHSESGLEAMRHASSQAINLIVIGFNVTDINRLELCQFLVNTGITHVLVFTQNEIEKSLISSFYSPNTVCVSAPVSLDNLRERVEAYLLEAQMRQSSMLSVGKEKPKSLHHNNFISFWTDELANIFHNDTENAWFDTSKLEAPLLLSDLFHISDLHLINRHILIMRDSGSSAFETKLINSIEPNKLVTVNLTKLKASHEKQYFSMVFTESKDKMSATSMFNVFSGDLDNNELSQLASQRDGVTGLPTRPLLLERLRKAIHYAQVHGKTVALIAISIDRFRIVNDAYGFDMGDEILRAFSRHLHSFLKSDDILARGTGNEFFILVPESEPASAIDHLCDRLLEQTIDNWCFDKIDFCSTLSIGVAMSPDHTHDHNLLYAKSIAAMHESKRLGKNQIQFYTDSIARNLDDLKTSALALKNAIANGEIKVYYQTKVDAAAKKVVGLEALVRWEKADGQIVRPDQFIPLAEETGLIVRIGELVLFEACKQLKELLKQAPSLTVAINVSAIQCRPRLVQTVAYALQTHSIPAAQLEIEITETVLANEEDVLLTLNSLHELGVKLSLDDFGKGFSCLSYLKTFPFDILKIDQSFVRNMLDDSTDQALVKTIVNMAKDLGLEPVAEGVETLAHVEVLRAIGCRSLQGYYFSRPCPADQIDLQWPD